MQARCAFLFVSLSSLAAGAAAQPPTTARWEKTIECPAGREYRDIREHAGRSEFCDRSVATGLSVKDGPSRAWHSEGHLATEGTYASGRRVGRWKVCDRFDRCRDEEHVILRPEEAARGVTPVVPVSYVDGRYVFDFGSCWSTRVSHRRGDALVELNIGGRAGNCDITYIPEGATNPPHEGPRSYLCTVPYSAGVRELESLDLKSSLAKAGIPHSCK